MRGRGAASQQVGYEMGSSQQSPPTKEPSTLRYLDPEQVKVFRGEEGGLYATIADEFTVLSPRFVRARPLSDPDRYLSIRGPEPGGKEFGLLPQWHRLDGESRRLVQAELERRYLHPTVGRILSLKDYAGLQLCLLETDRGVREVTFRDARDNVVYLGASRVLITDAEGNRYDIPDITALDRKSRALLALIL
jgi:hypothetical protein